MCYLVIKFYSNIIVSKEKRRKAKREKKKERKKEKGKCKLRIMSPVTNELTN